ncbi:hypothetical protein, partial [Pseudomonas aeruginosa]
QPIGNASSGIGLNANGNGLIQQSFAQGSAVTASSLNLAGAAGGIYLGFTTPIVAANGTGLVSLGNFDFGNSAIGNSSAASSFSLGSN